MNGNRTAWERVTLARHPDRPGTADYIAALFTDFFEQRGDRLCGEDGSILGGVALYHGRPVTVLGHRKGKTLEEHLRFRRKNSAARSLPLSTLPALIPAWRPRNGARGRPSPAPWPG